MAVERIDMDSLWREWEETLELQGYIRKRHLIRQEESAVQETEYRIELEWFPEAAADWEDEDRNPAGTVTVTLDARTRRLRFCHVRREEPSGTANHDSRRIAVEWIDRLTGLREEDGRLEPISETPEEDGIRFRFRQVEAGVRFFPGIHLEIRIGADGRLISYGDYGRHTGTDIPLLDKPRPAPDASLLRQIAYDAFSLVYMPEMSGKPRERHWLYGVGETFLDGLTGETMAYEWNLKLFGQPPLNRPILWSPEEERRFAEAAVTPEKVGVFINRFITSRESREVLIDWEEKHPDTVPIRPEEIERTYETVREWAGRRWPGGSGQWMISRVLRSNGMLMAVIERREAGYEVGLGRTKVVVDGENYTFVDAIEPAELPPRPPEVIEKEEAFRNIVEALTCKPYYVWDRNRKGYRFMHMVDCPLLVDALSGKVVTEL
ncbi:hypothetical protein [Paenibacillus mucilaginosus]|uniref:Uncharacterized protein n=2 Tax=Paenibacillus mucilaginosus TaxID=61624 RepID=H6NK04_9BACL|nr:hypothetical protein [Paenibacillus mucilaginosus]AEI43195.1 hypothetical protein KNP414_04665 [Paenibacillus mucilaginosus KNP414]AFC30857.1 hypothetical protein PM3016_4075 [Paenibacillus mucilaginosus 3016]MCG7212245.1 hypothetical protein [Paenibacillus mucilaginosus]WDM24789.1 hypothetical protein KCX80_20065 [Paenibacillus mucilaginosus]WFA19459.1 hypothetical protein ERY13_20505 [Paenibacillus mucilaginosus]